jgi:hypothetical protein
MSEIEREFVISLDLLGHRADVAKFHAELVVGRAGLRVVGTPSVVAEGLKPCEDFIDVHADDYMRKSSGPDEAASSNSCTTLRASVSTLSAPSFSSSRREKARISGRGPF